jgi:hypothetical protein
LAGIWEAGWETRPFRTIQKRGEEMKTAITFVRNIQTSIVTTKEELIKELNHYQAWWLSSVGSTYTNDTKGVKIVVAGMTEDDRNWLASRMR